MSMTPAQIAEERRRGLYAGPAAIAAGLLFPAGLFWTQAVNRDRPEDNSPAQLRFFDDHSGELLGASTLRSLALVLMVIVTVHLYRATKMRNPELNPVVLMMAVFGPLALAAGGLVHDISLAISSADFTEREFQTIEVADDVSKGPVQLVSIGLSVAGTAGLAFWFVMGSLNAMRVGLLSRFMGVLGIIVGPAFLLGLAPLVMIFWLIAVGALFLRVWPKGVPAAWDAGEAVLWPKAGESGRALDERPAGSRNGEVNPVGPGERRPEETEVDSPPTPRTRRKRKRRR